MNSLRVALVVFFVVSFCGCNREIAPVGAAAATQTVASPTCDPVKVSLLVDKSASAPQSRTAEVRTADLDPIIGLIGRCGGEISVGTIHDRRVTPFRRLRLAAGPTEPVRPEWSANKLQRRRQEGAFRPTLRAYEEALGTWNVEVKDRVDEFVATVEALLAEPANAQRSPIWDAVRRADAVLGEADPDWPVSGRWIVAVTDGIDDTGSRAVAIESGARLLVVNGLADAHSLSVLKPRQFESLSSALRAVVGETGALR